MKGYEELRCVYYLARFDLDLTLKSIKIGSSVSVVQRVSQLRDIVAPDQLLLLAIEQDRLRGSEFRGRAARGSTERSRHEQFAALRLHPEQEWFAPGRMLLAHIDTLRVQAAMPAVTSWLSERLLTPPAVFAKV